MSLLDARGVTKSFAGIAAEQLLWRPRNDSRAADLARANRKSPRRNQIIAVNQILGKSPCFNSGMNSQPQRKCLQNYFFLFQD